MGNMLNCWEYMRCGREPGGRNAAKLGVCPAALAAGHDGLNSGRNGGRICWAIAGTLCGGRVRSDYACKRISCMSCKFFKKVKSEEGVARFTLLTTSQMDPPNSQLGGDRRDIGLPSPG